MTRSLLVRLESWQGQHEREETPEERQQCSFTRKRKTTFPYDKTCICKDVEQQPETRLNWRVDDENEDNNQYEGHKTMFTTTIC